MIMTLHKMEKRLILPNGEVRPLREDQTALDVLGEDPRYLALRVGNRLWDLFRPLPEDVEEAHVLTFEDPEGREVYWHSTAHILAQAVKRLFPDFKLTIGPPIERGFYYDFDTGGYTFTPEDLERLEEEMRAIIRENFVVSRKDLPREEAARIFQERNEPYKLELLDSFEEETVSIYTQGEFVDLCRGPHVPRTSWIRAIKLLSSSSAYWRGDEKGPVLQRIYGISFPGEEQLASFLHKLEEAQRRDHRKLGRELELFTVSDEVGPGLILWLPRGARIRRIIEDLWRAEHDRRGYDLVYTPHVGKSRLWEISGHLEVYRENMYPPMTFEEGEEYFVKPMNCPFHIQIYRSRTRSYRDLPIRLAEIGTVYRYERSGVLHGLLRVRGFSQDDAHIFCRADQVEDEVIGVMEFALELLRTFGFEEFRVFLSTRPEKYVGSLEMWEHATRALQRALERLDLPYEVDEGGGAFYGPKIDMKLRDALDREWQCTTVQFDFNLPERFNLTYRGSDGKDHRPFMIHRALFGSFERFLGVLIEHYAGNFPFWLAPTQVRILPITDHQLPYARTVEASLCEAGLRVEVDDRNERVGYKISEAEREKIPVMFVVGKREAAASTVSLRIHGHGDQGTFPYSALIPVLKDMNRPGTPTETLLTWISQHKEATHR